MNAYWQNCQRFVPVRTQVSRSRRHDVRENGKGENLNMSMQLMMSGGGSTTPGGSSGDIQYNNAGAFGGVTVVPAANGGVANVSTTGEGYWFPEPLAESFAGKTFSTNSTIAATANRVYMAQTVLNRRQKISFFTFATGSAAGITSGNNFGYALYNHDGSSRLATINVAGTVAVSTAVRTAIAETTVTLDPGVYWIAWVCTLTTTTMNSIGNSVNTGLFGSLGGSVIRWGHASASNTSVAGSLPSSLVLPNTFLAQACPTIFCEP